MCLPRNRRWKLCDLNMAESQGETHLTNMQTIPPQASTSPLDDHQRTSVNRVACSFAGDESMQDVCDEIITELDQEIVLVWENRN